MKEVLGKILNDQRVWNWVGMFTVVAALGGVAWWGYGSYQTTRNQRAQWALAQQLERFTKLTQNVSSDVDAWREVERNLDTSFQEHKSSSLAPLFRAYQAEAALRSENFSGAYALMDEALAMMGKAHPLYYPYAVKRAVWLLDDAKGDHAAAVQQLLALAQDGKNPDPGLAWYHLWQYAVVKNESDMVKMAYAKLQGLANWSSLVQDTSLSVA